MDGTSRWVDQDNGNVSSLGGVATRFHAAKIEDAGYELVSPWAVADNAAPGVKAKATKKASTTTRVAAAVAAEKGNAKANGSLDAAAVGALVTGAREAAGLKTSELAERMGTSDGAVRRLERGDTNASVAYLVRVAEALGMSLTVTIA